MLCFVILFVFFKMKKILRKYLEKNRLKFLFHLAFVLVKENKITYSIVFICSHGKLKIIATGFLYEVNLGKQRTRFKVLIECHVNY